MPAPTSMSDAKMSAPTTTHDANKKAIETTRAEDREFAKWLVDLANSCVPKPKWAKFRQLPRWLLQAVIGDEIRTWDDACVLMTYGPRISAAEAKSRIEKAIAKHSRKH